MSEKLWRVTAVAYIKAETDSDAIDECDLEVDGLWDAIEVDDKHCPVSEVRDERENV
jgi:hypothetical protein